MKTAGVLALVLLLGVVALAVQQPATSPPAEAPPAATFHHVHLNVTNPEASAGFYAARFDCEKTLFEGKREAVRAQQSWLLFEKVATAAPWELNSSIWHFGWGAEDMKATYEKQIQMGTKFFTPLTDISDFTSIPGFFYAYVEGPDRELIELNTANHHRFGHLHLFSADPVGAGEWYIQHFGARRRGTRAPSREPRFFKGIQVGPSVSLMVDQVNVIIFPVEYSRQVYPEHWKGRTEIAPTAGRVVDHVAFGVDDLPATLKRLEAGGVKASAPVAVIPGTGVRSAFVDGPDGIRIEVVEKK